MTTHIFKIDGRSRVEERWGDYGSILQHGITAHLPRREGRLALERTGPHIPPITLPGIGDIVLTASARMLLESSGLTGFSFRPVEKVLTVELHWEDWDLNAEEPPHFPDSGEPEDYILGQPDSASASSALGELWELLAPATAIILRSKAIVYSHEELRLDLSTWNGADLFRSNGYASMLFSERARDWFSEHWGEYLEFEEFPTT
ncbi:MAG TPA: hypothetical protein VGF61_13725 [Candidatus Acidoferrum sp.]|jgi:hypothetical protein